MTAGSRSASASGRVPYPRFLAYAAGILAALLVVGYLPTLNLGRPQEAIPALLGSLALRLTVATGLAVAAALSGLLAVVPLLVWLLLAHLALLAADTHYALSYTKDPNAGRPPASPAGPLEPALEKR